MSGVESSSTGKKVSSVKWPVARTHDDVVVQEVLNEVVIYDLPRDKAHALNPTAAQVYRWCDGLTSPQVMAERLAACNNLSRRQGDALVGLALKLLRQEDLVAWTGILAPAMRSVTRRSALTRVGVAALVPVVYSLVAPTPAEAQSNATSTPTQSPTITPTRTLTPTPVTPTVTPTPTVSPAPTQQAVNCESNCNNVQNPSVTVGKCYTNNACTAFLGNLTCSVCIGGTGTRRFTYP
jgi:hypothetical protein